MKAGPIEIGRLLQNRQRFCVPIYQRHYVWSREKQWEPFWNDIRTKAIEYLAGRTRRFSHFMGAVVLEARGGFSAGRVPSFQVVDGQQRLTTFQLFLAAARDYATSTKFNTTADQIGSYLLNDKPNLMEDPAIEVFKVWPTQYDRELFIDIIRGDRKGLRKKYIQHFYAHSDKLYEYSTVPKLLAAYGYFFERIKHSVETDDLADEFLVASEGNGAATSNDDASLRELRLDAIWKALVEEFKMVEIILEEGDDAQVIFETLNERGEPLLAADLVRNNIFQRADAAGEKAEQLFATHWKSFEHPFWNVLEKQGRYKKPRIEFFLSNFISGQIAGEINLSKLFSEYKAFNKKRKYATVAQELIELERYGAIYRGLLERSDQTPLGRFARRLQPWDVTTVYPLVLRLWAAPDLDEIEKSRCLDLLLSYIVRRSVCNLTNKNYNKFFLAVVAHLEKDGWSFVKLSEYLVTQKADSSRFPNDDEFEVRWTNLPAYTMLQPARTKAVLEEIEVGKRTKFHETKSLAPNLTVEHVLPQQWAEHWPLPGGIKPTAQQQLDAAFNASGSSDPVVQAVAMRDRLKETFGNLTLLTQPFNSSLSHSSFQVKRKALEEQSLLAMNRELSKSQAWGEEEILARGKSLFAIAKELWPAPG